MVSKNVQSSASKASGASLAGQTFGAAKGATGLALPTVTLPRTRTLALTRTRTRTLTLTLTLARRTEGCPCSS